jgi:hypothetical protein
LSVLLLPPIIGSGTVYHRNLLAYVPESNIETMSMLLLPKHDCYEANGRTFLFWPLVIGSGTVFHSNRSAYLPESNAEPVSMLLLTKHDWIVVASPTIKSRTRDPIDANLKDIF